MTPTNIPTKTSDSKSKLKITGKVIYECELDRLLKQDGIIGDNQLHEFSSRPGDTFGGYGLRDDLITLLEQTALKARLDELGSLKQESTNFYQMAEVDDRITALKSQIKEAAK